MASDAPPSGPQAAPQLCQEEVQSAAQLAPGARVVEVAEAAGTPASV
jgi:hypothetical protein